MIFGPCNYPKMSGFVVIIVIVPDEPIVTAWAVELYLPNG
jgi:hypothetical protein